MYIVYKLLRAGSTKVKAFLGALITYNLTDSGGTSSNNWKHLLGIIISSRVFGVSPEGINTHQSVNWQ